MSQVYRFTDENGVVRLMAEISPAPGGGPAAGTYLPVANATGVTVDTTTYDDVLNGVGKMTTLVFPEIQGALAIAIAGDAFPRWVLGSRTSDGLYMSDGTVEPTQNGANIRSGGASGLTLDASSSSGIASLFGTTQVDAPTTTSSPPRMASVSPRFTITSGALPTVDFTGKSGTGQQVSTSRDVDIYVETGTAGSVVAALSPDNVTYTTIYTKTMALTDVCHARVPAGWYLKLTATTAVLGVGTYA